MDMKDIHFLKLDGVSQLEKEIRETKHLQNKIIDFKALHRNEQTDEIEGEDLESFIVKLKDVRKEASQDEHTMESPHKQDSIEAGSDVQKSTRRDASIDYENYYVNQVLE